MILRGARQVGKTTVVHSFAENFDHFIYLNLEREKDAVFFLETDNLKILLDKILFSKGINQKPNDEVLLFIDEIHFTSPNSTNPLIVKIIKQTLGKYLS